MRYGLWNNDRCSVDFSASAVSKRTRGAIETFNLQIVLLYFIGLRFCDRFFSPEQCVARIWCQEGHMQKLLGFTGGNYCRRIVAVRLCIGQSALKKIIVVSRGGHVLRGPIAGDANAPEPGHRPLYFMHVVFYFFLVKSLAITSVIWHFSFKFKMFISLPFTVMYFMFFKVPFSARYNFYAVLYSHRLAFKCFPISCFCKVYYVFCWCSFSRVFLSL